VTESEEMLKRAAMTGRDMRECDGVADTITIITDFKEKSS